MPCPRVCLECPISSLSAVPNSRVSRSAQRPNPRFSLKCPESPWSAQPQSLLECPTLSLPGVPNPKVFFWSAQPQSLPGVPNPIRVFLECPTIDCYWSAQSPGVPNPIVSLKCPTLSLPECPTPECSECPAPESPWSAQLQSVPVVTPKSPWSAQPTVSLECPTPESLYQEGVGMFEVNNLF